MNGMGFMIRLLLILLLISSCGNLPITYLQNFSSVNNVVFGFPEYEITADIYNEYENSFIKIRFGRGPHAILVLAYIKDDIYEWVGSDDVKIFTFNGRIIKTSGLDNNIEIPKPLDNIFLATAEVYESINLYNPDLYYATAKRSISSKNSSIKKLGQEIKVNKVRERFDIDSIGWSGTNIFYQNTQTNQIEFSEQQIHPRLPAVKIEYYFKY